jgi:hypothetical protein
MGQKKEKNKYRALNISTLSDFIRDGKRDFCF